MEYRTGGKVNVVKFKNNKVPEHIRSTHNECMKLYSGFQPNFDKLDEGFKLILTNCQEDIIKMYCAQGYQKELGWILEIIESYKRLHQTIKAEDKAMRKILKTARKVR